MQNVRIEKTRIMETPCIAEWCSEEKSVFQETSVIRKRVFCSYFCITETPAFRGKLCLKPVYRGGLYIVRVL